MRYDKAYKDTTDNHQHFVQEGIGYGYRQMSKLFPGES